MALDTSKDAYEKLYESSGPEDKDKYYDGYIEMKGRFKTWTKYWCVLKKKNLHFFKDVNTQIKEHYEGYFPLDGVTNIEVKTKNNEVHIIKSNKDRKIMLRMLNPQLIDIWLTSFKKALKGEPPDNSSHILPGSGAVSPVKRQPSLQHPPSSPTQRYHALRKASLDISHKPQEIQDNLVARARQIAQNVAQTDDEIRIQNQLLAGDKSWYQPTMRREDVEKTLKDLENGVFIVRDHIDKPTSKKMGYVISLKNREGQWRHHRIGEGPDNTLFLKIEGHEEKVFKSLPNVLLFFITSQRKSTTLTPYSPDMQPDDGYQLCYQVMDPAQSNGAQRRGQYGQKHSVSLDQPSNTRSHHPKARSQSLYNTPQTAALMQSVGRAESFKNRQLPRPPDDSQCFTDGYMNIEAPAQRPLPPPPEAVDEGEYLEPSDQNTGSFKMKTGSNADNSQSDSYVDMKSPRKLDRIPSGIELPISPPMTHDQNSSYVDMHPPFCYPSYENLEPNPNAEDQAPKLPPRRAKSMKDERLYVNLPGRGGDQPPRPPLRKANTLGR